jgi:GT2 family glycosyltransferase
MAMQEVALPIVSVCIANYNGIGVIEDCIASVKNQTGEINVEIIVHDDTSSDKSVEYIRIHHPDVALIQSKENVGFCISNNRMVSQAKGQYILLLNNDAKLLPDALTSLYQSAQELGMPTILGLPQYDATSGELLDAGSLLDPFLNPIPNLDLNRGQVGMVMGACMWIPKSLWEEIGGFPEFFGSIGEDLYLCCRARLAGYPVIALNRSGFQHRVGHSFGGGKLHRGQLITNRSRRSLSERNKTSVMLLCYPLLMLTLIFPLHLILLVLEGALLSLVKSDFDLWQKIYAPVIPALWSNRQNLLSLRSEIQRQRAVGLKAWLTPFRLTPYKLRLLLRHGIPDVR